MSGFLPVTELEQFGYKWFPTCVQTREILRPLIPYPTRAVQ